MPDPTIKTNTPASTITANIFVGSGPVNVQSEAAGGAKVSVPKPADTFTPAPNVSATNVAAGPFQGSPEYTLVIKQIELAKKNIETTILNARRDNTGSFTFSRVEVQQRVMRLTLAHALTQLRSTNTTEWPVLKRAPQNSTSFGGLDLDWHSMRFEELATFAISFTEMIRSFMELGSDATFLNSKEATLVKFHLRSDLFGFQEKVESAAPRNR